MYQQSEKNWLNSNTSSTCPHNMANFILCAYIPSLLCLFMALMHKRHKFWSVETAALVRKFDAWKGKSGVTSWKSSPVEQKFKIITTDRRLIPSVLWHCWLGGRKGIRPVKKYGGMVGLEQVRTDRVAPSRMVGVSASVNLPLHYKVQKFCPGNGSPRWSRKKGHKTVVVWLLLLLLLLRLFVVIIVITFFAWVELKVAACIAQVCQLCDADCFYRSPFWPTFHHSWSGWQVDFLCYWLIFIFVWCMRNLLIIDSIDIL